MTNEIDTKLCDVMREFVLLNKSVADPNLMDVSKLHGLGWHHKIALEDGIKLAYQDFLKLTEAGK
jgi:nucleoside-diphosphate-sugar epimerase